MANQYINAITDLWNSAGTTYAGIKLNVTNAASAAASKLLQLQIGTVDKFSVDKTGNVIAVGSVTSAGVISSGASLPSANDSAALGASGTAWADLFLASGGVINWLAGDVTITHSANLLTFGGSADGYRFDAAIAPTTNDVAALGSTTLMWADLFLATGATINYNNGNWISTHSDGVVTVTTGDFRITTAGTNALSAVTVGGAQTLTSKTLASPLINGSTINSATISGTLAATSATWSNLGAVTTCDINGGTIDGTIIGATTPAAITASTISASTGTFSSTLSSTSTISSPTATHATSVFGGKVQSGQVFEGTGTSVILSPAAGLNTIYFRPRGFSDGTGQCTIDNAGTFSAGTLQASQNIQSTSTHLTLGASSGAVFLRPYGANNGTNQGYQTTDGGFRTSFVHVSPDGSSTGTHGFYNASNPKGDGVCGGIFVGNGTGNSAGLHASGHHGAGFYAWLAFHQPNVALWGMYTPNAILAAGGFTTSDARVKSNIKKCDCSEAYRKMRAIPVKAYVKANFVERKGLEFNEIGFLAQEVEGLIPEAVIDIPVAEPDEKHFVKPYTRTLKHTNDRTMLATLWAAVQHQADMIERLEETVEKLKKGAK